MKATVVGGVAEAALRAALHQVLPGTHEIRVIDRLAYAALPDPVGVEVLGSLQRAVGGELTVAEVEMGLGMRGSDLRASRRVLPGGTEEDLTGEARETLHEWLADASGPEFDEDVAALDLAFSLIADEDDEPEPAASAEIDEEEAAGERWARRFFEKLIADGALEMRSKRWPIGPIAELFGPWIDFEREHVEDEGLGEHLLELLVDSTAVEEVFADEAALVEAMHATRRTR